MTALVAMGYQPHWWTILGSPFMHNALIGGTVVALASGLMGYFIVVRRNAFASHALAHIGLPGATGAVLLGVPPVLGLGVFCVGGALVIGAMGKRMADRDVVTGTVLAFATGLGLFFNSLATKSSSTMTNVLFGNLLAITGDQLVGFSVLFAILTLCVGLVYRPLLYSSVNAPVAEAKGVPVRALSVVFMVLLALAVMMAVQAVGTLLLSALLITPAATGIMLTPRPSRAMAIAAVISVVSVWVGLGASAMFNMPPSFLVVTVACGIWLAVWSVDRARQSRRPAGQSGVDHPVHAMAAPTRCPTK